MSVRISVPAFCKPLKFYEPLSENSLSRFNLSIILDRICCLILVFYPYEQVKANNVPIVIDADGLWHLNTNPGIIKVSNCVYTVNFLEGLL